MPFNPKVTGSIPVRPTTNPLQMGLPAGGCLDHRWTRMTAQRANPRRFTREMTNLLRHPIQTVLLI